MVAFVLQFVEKLESDNHYLLQTITENTQALTETQSKWENVQQNSSQKEELFQSVEDICLGSQMALGEIQSLEDEFKDLVMHGLGMKKLLI
jgi:hypothetical protein